MRMLLNLKNIYKNYGKEPLIVPVLKDISLEVIQGDYVAIMGPSGSGKTTLMNIIGCLDRASTGTYLFEDEDISEMNDDALSDLRLNKIGFVFQNFNLLSSETAQENVALPLIYAGIHKEERNHRADVALSKVGLQDRTTFKPSQLSGGQKQRVAIARALINHPRILLADEPTGALDQASGKQVMELFKALNDEGVTIIMITHDASVASHAKRFFISLMEKSLKINKEVQHETFYKKGIIITSVCAFTLVGIKFYLSLSNTIEVHSVSSLNTGYWDNPATSTGLVSNSDTQSVLYDSSKTITQVFVKEGQQVSVGDPLLSYDLTTLQSAVDTSQLEVEKAQNAITLANHELKKLLNTTPVPDVTPAPDPQDPTPAPLPDMPKKMVKACIHIFFLYPKLKRILQTIRSIIQIQKVTRLKKDLKKMWMHGKKKELKKHRIIHVGIGSNIHIQMVQTMRMIQRMLLSIIVTNKRFLMKTFLQLEPKRIPMCSS